MITSLFAHLVHAIIRRLADPVLAGSRQQLTNIETRIITMSDTFTTEMTKLHADVAAQGTVIASATAAFTGLAEQLKAAEGKAIQAGATAEQIADLTAVRTGFEANTAALAAAIPVGTSAAVSTETGAELSTESGAPISTGTTSELTA